MFDRARYTLHRTKKRLLWPLRKRFPAFANRLDDPRREKTLCQCCGRLVSFSAWHLGFSDFLALSCDRCPDVLLVDDHDRFPYGVATSASTSDFGQNWLTEIQKIDVALPGCRCGGRFAYMNPPRCPHCLGLVLGDAYEQKPVMKAREGYSIVSRHAFRVHDLETKQPNQSAQTRSLARPV